MVEYELRGRKYTDVTWDMFIVKISFEIAPKDTHILSARQHPCHYSAPYLNLIFTEGPSFLLRTNKKTKTERRSRR